MTDSINIGPINLDLRDRTPAAAKAAERARALATARLSDEQGREAGQPLSPVFFASVLSDIINEITNGRWGDIQAFVRDVVNEVAYLAAAQAKLSELLLQLGRIQTEVAVRSVLKQATSLEDSVIDELVGSLSTTLDEAATLQRAAVTMEQQGLSL